MDFTCMKSKSFNLVKEVFDFKCLSLFRGDLSGGCL